MRCWHSDDKSKYIINKGVECLKVKAHFSWLQRKEVICHTKLQETDFLELCFSVEAQMTSVFITILKGYAEKLINANFRVLSFNKDHTVYYRPHYYSYK